MQPRRVLLVEINEDGTVGGSHQCLYDLALRLDRSAWQPVALFYQHNRFVDLLREAGVETHAWDAQRAGERSRRFRSGLAGKLTTAFKAPGAVLRRLAFLRRARIDLVHLNNSPCVGFDDWLPAARLARVPILSHARGPYVAPGGRIARRLVARFDAVVAISRYIAENFEMNGVPAERIRQVHDGIDLARWAPRPDAEGRALRSAAGVPDDALLVVLVGLLRSWKGQGVALRALAALEPEVRRRVRLWIVGEAPQSDAAYADGLHAFVREHALHEQVSFLGFRSDVPQVMGAADVVLHASTVPEPFGLVVVEGLALGKAVIASHCGGPAEIIGPGDGLLFDPAEPSELARLLTLLATSPAERQKLGQQARARARAFDVQRTVDGVARVWRELPERRAR